MTSTGTAYPNFVSATELLSFRHLDQLYADQRGRIVTSTFFTFSVLTGTWDFRSIASRMS